MFVSYRTATINPYQPISSSTCPLMIRLKCRKFSNTFCKYYSSYQLLPRLNISTRYLKSLNGINQTPKLTGWRLCPPFGEVKFGIHCLVYLQQRVLWFSLAMPAEFAQDGICLPNRIKTFVKANRSSKSWNEAHIYCIVAPGLQSPLVLDSATF